MNMNNQNNNSKITTTTIQIVSRRPNHPYRLISREVKPPLNLCRIRCSNGNMKFLGIRTRGGVYNLINFEKSDYKQFYIC